MSITREITADDWGKLNNNDQSLYEKDGEGYKFIGVNPSKLMTAKQHEKERANKALDQYNSLQKEVEALREQIESNEAPKPVEKAPEQATSPHLAEVQKLKQKLATKEADYKKAIAAQEEIIKNTELQRVISEASSKAFDNPHVGSLILEKRLAVDMQDGKPRVRFRGRDGEFDDSLDMEGLIKDIGADDRYKSMALTQGRSSGTGGIEQGMGTPESDQFAKSGTLHDALKEVDIATLKPEQIETLVSKFGTEEPLEQFRR